MVAVEKERRRVSKEVHDHLNQSLTGLSLMLEAVVDPADVAGHATADVVIPAAKWGRLMELFQVVIEDAHRLHDRLAPLHRRGQNLALALEKLVLEARQKLPCELLCDPADVAKITDSTVQMALYRIAQESLDNAVRHARASRLEIRCQGQDGQFKLEVLDDGRGVQPSDLHRSEGGWFLMQAYAKAIGATLRFSARSEGGSCVECLAPGGEEQ